MPSRAGGASKRTTTKKRTAGAGASGAKRVKKKTPKQASSARRKKAPAKAGASKKMTYFFGASRNEGSGEMKSLLGGKGANLAEMTAIGLPVPPGFTITTDTCAAYNEAGRRFPQGLEAEIEKSIRLLEQETGKRFGDPEKPLLVSVRSGAAVSMPGMMDTILNLGLNDESVAGLAANSGNPRFAYDAYRRLINMFGDVVKGVDHAEFEKEFDRVKHKLGVREDTEVPTPGMIDLCDRYKKIYRRQVGEAFPQDPLEQLADAVRAVFESWNSQRAVTYRRISGISGLPGTAVNVQAMAFGNFGEDSGTGVAFTRNPSTGDNTFYGEFLVNAQGEDVVAGIRTPRPVREMPKWNRAVHKRLLEIKDILESHYRDMQDIEFTIERGELFMLQTRAGKRTGHAAVKIACDMAKEKLISEDEALLRVPAGDLTQLLLPAFSAASKKKATLLTRGLPASPGAAVGKLAFTAGEAVDRMLEGEREDVILVRKETSPEDVEGMHVAAGILTSTGGMTSHAAVVARGWGKCCVVGAGEISIDEKRGKITVGGKTFGRGDTVSIDGNTGEVMEGTVEAPPPKMSPEFSRLMGWADKRRRLKVRANADTPQDATRAREFGAQGIGLCRTEHHVPRGRPASRSCRQVILAGTPEERPACRARAAARRSSGPTSPELLEVMDGLHRRRCGCSTRRCTSSCRTSRRRRRRWPSASASRPATSASASRSSARRTPCSGTGAAAWR